MIVQYRRHFPVIPAKIKQANWKVLALIGQPEIFVFEFFFNFGQVRTFVGQVECRHHWIGRWESEIGRWCKAFICIYAWEWVTEAIVLSTLLTFAAMTVIVMWSIDSKSVIITLILINPSFGWSKLLILIYKCYLAPRINNWWTISYSWHCAANMIGVISGEKRVSAPS